MGSYVEKKTIIKDDGEVEFGDRDKLIYKIRRGNIQKKWRAGWLYSFSDESPIMSIFRRVMYYEEPAFTVLTNSVLPLGTAKSNNSFAMSKKLAEMANTDFTPDHDIKFSGKDFFERLNEIKEPGEVCWWDEGGIGGGGSRDWRSSINQKINKALRLKRDRKPFLFFVSPYPGFLDLQTRVLCNIECECIIADKSKDESIAILKSKQWAQDKWGRYFVQDAILREIPKAWLGYEDEVSEDEINGIKGVNQIIFPNMKKEDPAGWKEYQKLKEEARSKMENGDDEEEEERKEIKAEESNIMNKIKKFAMDSYKDNTTKGDCVDEAFVKYGMTPRNTREIVFSIYRWMDKNKVCRTNVV